MNPRALNPGTAAAALWVVGSAWVVLGGWVFSLSGLLNRASCAALLIGLVGGAAWAISRGRNAAWWRRMVRRLRSPWAGGWLLLWLLATLGGALHAPNNIDALTYRLPRVLHWLAAEGWHWIASNDARMNYSATGMEWQMAPLLAVTGSDRLLFLLNALPALLLPGLVFSFLHGSGITRRVAVRWMWLLPAGHVFILQAGGIGNDANGAILFLAACDFARRAGKERGVCWLGLSLVAAGLMTGWKTSNLPLLLPWVVVVWPALPVARRRPISLAGFALVALLVSALPTLALNQRHTGHWSGDPANTTGVRLTSQPAGLPGNVTQAIVQNLVPPIFPWAGAWNAWSDRRLEPVVRGWMGDDFPRFSLRAGELPQEEWAGLGLLLILLLLGGAGRGLLVGGRTAWLGWTGWIAAGVFCLGLGSEMTARLLAPYYPVLVLPLLRCGRQARWLGSHVAQGLALLVLISTAFVLVVTPARPLLPLEKWTAPKTAECVPKMGRIATVYSVYARRADSLADLRMALPESVPEVGFMASADDAETSLWRPYGLRHVVRLEPGQSPGDLEWLVVRTDVVWPDAADEGLWLERWNGTVVRRQELRLKASRAPEQWALVRISSAGKSAGP